MNHCVFTPVRPVSGLASSANPLTPHRLCQHSCPVWSTADSMHFTVHSHSQHDPIFSLFRQRHLNDSQMASNRFHLFMLHEPLMAYVHVITAGRQRFDLNGEDVINIQNGTSSGKMRISIWFFFYITHFHSTYRARIHSLQATSRLFLLTVPTRCSFRLYQEHLEASAAFATFNNVNGTGGKESFLWSG